MQATMDMQCGAGTRFLFARHRTMVRSEKRRRSARRNAGQGGRPRRPRRAGFLYILCTILLLLLIWPIGLILLWQRKLRWGTLTKVFVSIVTMMASILIIGAALTAQVDNPRVTAVQDEVLGFLDSAADVLVDFGADVGERAGRSMAAVSDIGTLCRTQSLGRLADAIDWGLDATKGARDGLAGLFERGEGEDSPAATTSPSPGASATTTPEATSVPAEDVRVDAGDDQLPVYIPSNAPTPAAGTPLTEGMVLRSGKLKPGPLPSPTPEPEPEEVSVALKPASDATVYFNIGSGRYYHMQPVCGSMKNADAHSFAETAENIHEPCERCNPPEKSLLEETYIAWLDEGDVVHTSDDCASFQGQWRLITADSAIEAGYQTCPDCGADRYLEAIAAGAEVTLTQATPEPSPETSETPETTGEPAASPEASASTSDAPSTSPQASKPAGSPLPTLKPIRTPTATPTIRPTTGQINNTV